MGGHAFLSLDDGVYVTANPHVTSGLSWQNIRWALSSFRAEFWHPLTWLSYMVDTELYGVRAGGYLFSNLLLHIINTVLVFYLYRLFFQRIWEAAVVAALFALHPLHVEPVVWISERKELLAAFFWLLALLAYWRYAQKAGWQGWKRYLTLVLFFICGFMAKSMIITLPFLLLVLDYWPLQRDRRQSVPNDSYNNDPWRVWRYLVLEKAPLFGLVIIGIIITFMARGAGGGVGPLSEMPLFTRLANASLAYVMYIKNTLWPTRLSVFYPVDVNVPPVVIVLSIAILISLSYCFLRASVHHRFFLTGWLWFVGTLVPVIGLVTFGDVFMADRFMYMPALGLFIIMAGGARLLIERLPFYKSWLVIIPPAIMSVCVPITYAQIQTWQNSQALYARARHAVKGNYLAHHALGETAAKNGNWGRAVFHFAKAVNLRPDKAVFWIKLGRALVGAGHWQQARYCFERAADLAPEHPKPGFYIGCTAVFNGDIPAAVDHFAFSLKRTWEKFPPDDKISPRMEYCYRKGADYDKNNQKKIAMHYYQDALALMPGYFPAVAALGRLYREAGETDALLALYGVSDTPSALRSLVIVGYEGWKARMVNLKAAQPELL